MDVVAKRIVDALVERARNVTPEAYALASSTAGAARVQIEGHPLGMLAAFFELEDRCVRLHVWSDLGDTFRDAFGRYHDHIWVLESHILGGSLAHEVFDVIPDPNGTEVWLRDYDRATLTRGNERVSLASRYVQHLHVGDSYRLEAGEVHSTTAHRGTITLVDAVPSARRTARIIGGNLSTSSLPQRRSGVDAVQMLDALTHTY